MINKLSKMWKAVLAEALAIATWAVVALSQPHFTAASWASLVVAILSGPGVWVVPNKPPDPTPLPQVIPVDSPPAA